MKKGDTTIGALEYLRDSVLLLDNDFTILGVNKITEELFGFPKEVLIGKKCYQSFHQSDSPPDNCPLLNCLKTGMGQQEAEIFFPHLGNKWFWTSVSSMGEKGPWIHLARNITHYKEAEERLKKSEQRYRELFEKSAAGIFRISPEGRFLDVNSRFLEILGYNDVEGLRKSELVRDLCLIPEDWSRFVEAIETKERVDRYRIWLKRKDGTPVCISVYAMAEKDKEGNPLYYHGTVIDITERMKAVQALRRLEERWALFADRAPIGLFQFTPIGEIVSANPYMAKMMGTTVDKLIGTNLFKEIWEDSSEVRAWLEKLETSGEVVGREIKIGREDGSSLWLRFHIYKVREGGGALYEGICQDVTTEKMYQGQLYLLHKMEAIGRLAGGVAHDFNNMLMVILGTCDLLLHDLGETHPGYERILIIRKAAERAASLTRQLLAFSRRQVMEPRVIDLNRVLEGTEKILRRLIGEDIELKVRLAPDLWKVKADPAQVEQVIMNLAVNARDAMPRGGVLAIETTNVKLDEVYARDHVGVKPGEYVMLAVSDTGHGMDDETKARIFEPFFTTRSGGTGLGLSTVYGIVKQSGGNIWCYSEPGEGTTFKVYLPRVEGAMEERVSEGAEVSIGGTEMLILVEDDEKVREIAATVLREAGYQVLEASNGEEALEVCKKHKGSIDMVITDVVMPGMSGKELAERLRAIDPKIKVLYMSGYTGDIIAYRDVLEEMPNFIQKPFARNALLKRVRQVLDGS